MSFLSMAAPLRLRPPDLPRKLGGPLQTPQESWFAKDLSTDSNAAAADADRLTDV
jgi:hypothetical protein